MANFMRKLLPSRASGFDSKSAVDSKDFLHFIVRSSSTLGHILSAAHLRFYLALLIDIERRSRLTLSTASSVRRSSADRGELHVPC